jgi:hypothetical protein
VAGSRQDWAVDAGDKIVNILAIEAVFDRALSPAA